MQQKIGNGTFYQGDCFDVMRSLPDGCVDMILCDLPYGTTACAWDSVLPFDELWREYYRLCKSDGAIVLTASMPFSAVLASSNLKGYAYSWVWDKKFAANFVQAKRQPLKIHEDVLVFCQTGKMPRYNPQKTAREHPIKKGGNKQSAAIPIRRTEAAEAFGAEGKVYDDKHPESVLKFSSRDESRGLHPTQKPVALFEYLIRTYTDEGMVVLDNTAGSGTTAIAAENANRRWICIERDEDYYTKAVERIRQHVGQATPIPSFDDLFAA